MMIGSLVSGPIVDAYATSAGHDWKSVWLIPGAIAVVVVILFLLLFKDTNKPSGVTPTGMQEDIAINPNI
jgi:sugar phosphate permease